MNWFFIEKIGGDEFETQLLAGDRICAIHEAWSTFRRLSNHDRGRRAEAYVILADRDEDGCIDWDGVKACEDIKGAVIVTNPFGLFDYAVIGASSKEAAAELEQKLEYIEKLPGNRYIADSIESATRTVAEKYNVYVGATV